MMLLIMSLLHISIPSYITGPNILLSVLLPDTPDLCSWLMYAANFHTNT
jgi:hypothetical protein